MSTMVTTQYEEPPTVSESPIDLPLGLLGFEQFKKYLLVAAPEEHPFMWLQMTEAPRHSFLVIPPAEVLPDYQPDISDEDATFLGLRQPHDAMVFNIVTLRNGGPATVNLKGPIILNRRTRVAKQVIPRNAARFPLQHPLPQVS